MFGPQGLFDMGHRLTHVILIAIALMVFQMWERSRIDVQAALPQPPLGPPSAPPPLPPVVQQPPPAVLHAQHTPVAPTMSTPISSL